MNIPLIIESVCLHSAYCYFGIVSKCVWEPVHMLTLFKGIFSPSVYHKAIYDKHMVQICGSLWTLKSVNFLSYSVRQSPP